MTGADWLIVVAVLIGVVPTVSGIAWFIIASVRAHGRDEG